jgi:uncharacterized surface protein with fasciclin (FAS1) repeats
MRKIITILAVFCSCTGFFACKKNSVFKNVDYNRITSILADNYNLSIFGAALNRTGMDLVLQEEQGPFTALVPSDAAFEGAGISDSKALRAQPIEWISKLSNYHVLNGIYELQRFPFLINQEIRSRGGGRLYVSRWIKGNDTVLTVNGARVMLKDIPASNGRIQIINRVLEPYEHDELANAIAANQDITLFTEALRRSGLLEMLSTKGPYTVFAPSNAAMQAQGFLSIQQLRETDRTQLKELCEYHIAQDRRFINDYILSTGSSNSGSQRMTNTFTITINLIPDPYAPDNFIGINLLAPGNIAPISIKRRDILSGNGVLHVINGVLRMTR